LGQGHFLEDTILKEKEGAPDICDNWRYASATTFRFDYAPRTPALHDDWGSRCFDAESWSKTQLVALELKDKVTEYHTHLMPNWGHRLAGWRYVHETTVRDKGLSFGVSQLLQDV
jgi:hypothetical protein